MPIDAKSVIVANIDLKDDEQLVIQIPRDCFEDDVKRLKARLQEMFGKDVLRRILITSDEVKFTTLRIPDLAEKHLLGKDPEQV